MSPNLPLPDDPDAPVSGTAVLEGAEIGLNLIPEGSRTNVVLAAAAPAVLASWPSLAAAVRAEARTRLAELGYEPTTDDLRFRPWCVTLEGGDDAPDIPPAVAWSFWADDEEDAYVDVITVAGSVESWELRSIEGG